MQIFSWESSCIEVFRPKETQNEVSEVSGKVTGWNLSEFLHEVIAAYKPKKTVIFWKIFFGGLLGKKGFSLSF